MNNIVEINYPNLESYFKELLLKQEFSRKCYWSAIKENLSEALAYNWSQCCYNILSIFIFSLLLVRSNQGCYFKYFRI